MPAATTLEELNELIAPVRRTGLTHVMAETSLHYGTRLYMEEKWDAADFGHFVYGEGEYYHDVAHGSFEALQYSVITSEWRDTTRSLHLVLDQKEGAVAITLSSRQ